MIPTSIPMLKEDECDGAVVVAVVVVMEVSVVVAAVGG